MLRDMDLQPDTLHMPFVGSHEAVTVDRVGTTNAKTSPAYTVCLVYSSVQQQVGVCLIRCTNLV